MPAVEIIRRGWRGKRMRSAGAREQPNLSGLMMAGADLGQRFRLEIVGELVSMPYVRMTARLMDRSGDGGLEF